MYQRKDLFLVSVFSVIIVVLLIGWVNQVQSQDKYPTRSIEIIAPVPPGSGIDLTARLTGAYMSKKWGVPIVVANKPGGTFIPGLLEVYNARPDGYTLLADSTNTSSILPVGLKDLPFKIMDRTFICMVNVSEFFFVVPSNSPYKTLEDIILDAKKDPGNFTWTSMGASTLDYHVRSLFKTIGVDIKKTKPVMCQGGALATNLTAGGHVKLGTNSVSGNSAAVKAGLIRAIAVTGKSRHADFPDVPTFQELGYPTVTTRCWYGISGPPKLPLYIVDMWNEAVKEMVKDPEVVSRIKNIGTIPFYHNAKETKDEVIKDMEETTKLWN